MSRKMSRAAAYGAGVLVVALLVVAGAGHWLELELAGVDFSALVTPPTPR